MHPDQLLSNQLEPRSAVPGKALHKFAISLFSITLAFPIAPAFGQSANPFGSPSADKPFPAEDIQAFRGTRGFGWKDQTRSEVTARNGMVASSQPLATQAGLEILQKGGNAIDAAVAAAAVNGVVEPISTGIGGDLFAIIWSAKHQKLFALNSSGWAPKGWTPEFFKNTLGVTSVPSNGVNSAVVPGAVSGWDAMLSRFGNMTFREALEPAERIAAQGWAVGERSADEQRDSWPDPDSAQVFMPDGKKTPLYGIQSNPDLAKALRMLRNQGRDAFYKGRIARAIVDKVQSGGGVMTMEDLAEYQSDWVQPLSTNYHGFDVFELPPPGQGFAALEMLNILEVCAPRKGVNLSQMGHNDPNYWHFMIEAKKLAYSDLHRYNADPKFERVPLNRLLSKRYAERQCDKIDMNAARPADVLGNIGPGTIYLTTADRWGNMVSLVYSVFGYYGSLATVPPYGFLLNNRGGGFTLDENHPNVVAPHKRPFITIIAGFVMKDGRPKMSFGNMSGAVQAQAHAQHIVNMVDLGFNAQATTDAARFDHNQAADRVSLDEYLYDAVGSSLAAKGHDVRVRNDVGGGYQGLYFERDPLLSAPGQGNHKKPVNGIYRAGSDHRKDGQAAGY